LNYRLPGDENFLMLSLKELTGARDSCANRCRHRCEWNRCVAARQLWPDITPVVTHVSTRDHTTQRPLQRIALFDWDATGHPVAEARGRDVHSPGDVRKSRGVDGFSQFRHGAN
jgi:hypothetical protein